MYPLYVGMTVGFCLPGTFSKQKNHTQKSFLYFLKNVFLYSRMDTVKKNSYSFSYLRIEADQAVAQKNTPLFFGITADIVYLGHFPNPNLKLKNILPEKFLIFFENKFSYFLR